MFARSLKFELRMSELQTMARQGSPIGIEQP